jgi:hypothetical protein
MLNSPLDSSMRAVQALNTDSPVSRQNLNASSYVTFHLLTAADVQYTDQEMIPARNARHVVTLAEVMFVTIQRENILPSKITDY